MANDKDVKEVVKEVSKEQNFDDKMLRALETLVPAIVVALEKSRGEMAKKDNLQLEMTRIREQTAKERCPVCRQPKGGCGYVEGQKEDEQHVKMAVIPMRGDLAPWFQGIFINGICYLSNNTGHKIWVPKMAEGSIQRGIEDFEDNEQHLRMPRVGGNHLGNVGPNGHQGGSNPNNINVGFR